MTEEQKKKIEEIYNLHIDFPLKIRPIFLPKFGWVKIAMLLAEVFNKNITEEEAGEIFDNIFNDINKNGMNCVKAKAILLPIGINPISQSNYKDTFWKIANYFDEEQKNNKDFISKEFIVKNYLGFDANPGYEIITFIKSLDGKVEIENKGGKRVKATSFLKILSLGIHYNDKITIYCYGENKEKNLKEIEEFFKGIEVYPIEEIKENKNNKINNVVENTAKEKIMSNNDELTLNLLILGQTGVGKSSLINALLGKKVAKAGLGKPISTHIQEYKTELDGKKVNLYDSMGFEVKNEKCIDDIKNALKERSADKDIKDWFHSVTYCIQAGGLKIQDFDIKMIKQFVDEKYNVIIALTKSDQLGKAKREEFIEIIKKEVKEATKKDIMVITVAGDPEQLDHMTEKPKPYGLEEYKAAILISWREIFINRIPVHIVKKLKEDIENAKSNAPRKGKDKELSNKIQEYFSNILNANTQKYVRESIEKYYKITADILASSKNINLSNKKLDLNFYSEFDNDGTIEFLAEMFRDFGDLDFGWRIKLILLAPLAAIPMGILEFGIVRPLEFLLHIMEKGDKIEKFINDVSEEYTKKIGEEEFESEIRKIIINALNEIDKKIIKLN